MKRSILSALLAALCLVAPLGAHADGQGEAQRALPAEGGGAQAQPPLIEGYATESGRRLPLTGYGPYQAARRMWTAGFVATLSCLALAGTGVGVMLVGRQDTASFTPEGRDRALAAGGSLLAVGLAGSAAGAALWAVGSRDLGRIERGLPLAGTHVAWDGLGVSGTF